MIYLLWCTIRPEMFMGTHAYWMRMCTNKKQVKTIVAVNTQEQSDRLTEYSEENNCEIIITGTERTGAAYPTYCMTSRLQGEKGDIVVLSSDDFFPPQHWDDYVIDKFKDFSGCLFVRDGFQIPDYHFVLPSITIPIMTYECLEKLNKVINHPAYQHMFADTELYENVKELGLLKDERKTDFTTFEHRHYCVGKRVYDEHDEKYKSYYEADQKTFETRMKLPVEERLKV